MGEGGGGEGELRGWVDGGGRTWRGGVEKVG